MKYRITVIEDDDQVVGDLRYPTLHRMLTAAEGMLVETTVDLSLRLIAPGIDMSVQFGDTIRVSMSINSDHHEDDDDEELVREFAANLMRAL